MLKTMVKKQTSEIPVLAGRLRWARIQAGLTQGDVAQRLKMGISQISKYENGQVLPGVDTLLNMAMLYRVSTDYLMGTSESSVGADPSLSKDESDLIEAHRRGDAGTLLMLLSKFQSNKRKQ